MVRMRFLLFLLKSITILFCLGFAEMILAQTKTNIVWIVCEDISPFIGAYGDPIVRTPNIDKLASEGIRFTHVYTTAGVCAPSRSSIITGMNQINIGTMHMRTHNRPDLMPEGVPSHSAVLPVGVKAFPEFLRKVGYYTTNNAKEDYQFEEPVTVWDESSVAASYTNREGNQPFFSVFNLAISHESQIISPPDSLYYDVEKMNLPLYYENTKMMRHDMAAMYTRIEQMDDDVGEVIAKLKADGVYENSYVFFFSDHGGNLPWMKREILERGTRIPFIVKLPNGKSAGTTNNDLISSIDFAPTVLSIAGIKPPEYLEGKAFLGEYSTSEKNKYVFAARDRMANKYDRVRSVSDGTFRYVYNFHPEVSKYQDLAYRKQMGSMQEILDLRDSGKINNPYLEDWFNTPKEVEELYYTTKDPDEINNLAKNKYYQSKKDELKKALFDWLSRMDDKAQVCESDMVMNDWWKGKNKPPTTKSPKLKKLKEGFQITNQEPGASIGYRIFDGQVKDTVITKKMKSWDFAYVMGNGNNTKVKVSKPWKVYLGGTIPLKKGQILQINTQRIGYNPSEDLIKF